MSGRCTFPRAEVEALVADARRCWAENGPPPPFFEKEVGPQFLLVGDDGIYLLHNGNGHARIGDENSRLRVVYAREVNPETHPHDVWERKREIWGGDDGSELIEPAEIEAALELEGDVVIHVTPDHLEIEIRGKSH